MTECKVCRAPKDGHRHCSDCGAELRRGRRPIHADTCRHTLRLTQDGQQCPTCKRLLAAGADCPQHGPATSPVITH